MKLVKNPDARQLNELIEASTHKAAKWIKGSDGSVYAWPAEAMIHADAAKLAGIAEYTKGIAVPATGEANS